MILSTFTFRMKQRDQEKRLLTEKVTELEDKVRYVLIFFSCLERLYGHEDVGHLYNPWPPQIGAEQHP